MHLFDIPRIQRETGLTAIDYHDELGSTNSRALELALDQQCQLPMLVLSERQLAGRGRGENRWWAGRGALTFSLLIHGTAAGFPKRNWPLLSMTTALSVAEVLAEVIPACDVRIKWPNDVYVNGRKICGILVENSTRPLERLVIGVGINVNNSLSDAPPELRGKATSLVDLVDRCVDRNDVLIGVLRQLLNYLPTLLSDTWCHADAWRQRCYLQGRTVQLDHRGTVLTGICQGIDDHGALLLLTEGGVQRCFGGVVARIL